MKLKRSILLSILFVFLMSITVFAAGNYIKDDARVLSPSTISQVNANFSKLETNTGAVVRIAVIQSLNGKSIDDYATMISKQGISTNKFAIFVVSVGDHKNKFLAGSGLNAVFNSSEINRIASLPNGYFKNSNFNQGILQVGQAIDTDITTKAVKTGVATVVNNGLSKTVKPVQTVQPKSSNAGKVFLIVLLIVGIIVIIMCIVAHKAEKARKDKEQLDLYERLKEEDDRKLRREIDSLNIVGTSVTNKETTISNPINEPVKQTHVTGSSLHAARTTVINNNTTTVINNDHGHTGYNGYNNNNAYRNNNNGFVEGMIVGEMLEESRDRERRVERGYEHTRNEEVSPVSSGDWNSGSGNSDWNPTPSNDGGSDWSSTSVSSDDGGGSSWDSSDTGSSFDSGSGDGGSSW